MSKKPLNEFNYRDHSDSSGAVVDALVKGGRAVKKSLSSGANAITDNLKNTKFGYDVRGQMVFKTWRDTFWKDWIAYSRANNLAPTEKNLRAWFDLVFKKYFNEPDKFEQEAEKEVEIKQSEKKSEPLVNDKGKLNRETLQSIYDGLANPQKVKDALQSVDMLIKFAVNHGGPAKDEVLKFIDFLKKKRPNTAGEIDEFLKTAKGAQPQTLRDVSTQLKSMESKTFDMAKYLIENKISSKKDITEAYNLIFEDEELSKAQIGNFFGTIARKFLSNPQIMKNAMNGQTPHEVLNMLDGHVDAPIQQPIAQEPKQKPVQNKKYSSSMISWNGFTKVLRQFNFSQRDDDVFIKPLLVAIREDNEMDMKKYLAKIPANKKDIFIMALLEYYVETT